MTPQQVAAWFKPRCNVDIACLALTVSRSKVRLRVSSHRCAKEHPEAYQPHAGTDARIVPPALQLKTIRKGPAKGMIVIIVSFRIEAG
jgi:hypothetical protein